jgi:hypothetical protein
LPWDLLQLLATHNESEQNKQTKAFFSFCSFTAFQAFYLFLKLDMDISSATLVGIGGVLVAGSSIVIFLVNYRRCFKKREAQVEQVNTVNAVHVWA